MTVSVQYPMNEQAQLVNVSQIKAEIKAEPLEDANKGSAGFICPQCQSHFLCSDFFVEHVRKHHLNSPSCKDTNSDPKNSSLNSEMKNFAEKGCKPASSTQTIPFKYNGIHVKETHLSENLDRCNTYSLPTTLLSNRFANESAYFTDRKRYECGTCSKIFSQKSSLNIHERTHTGDKPYACGICSRPFAQQGHMRRHERTHTGEKSFKCEICSVSFARRRTLRSHMGTHTTSIAA